MSHQLEFREALVSFLKTELIGPEKEDEVLVESPCRRYVAGILFPTNQIIVEAEDDNEVKDPPEGEEAQAGALFDAVELPAEPHKTGGSDDAGDAVYDDAIVVRIVAG